MYHKGSENTFTNEGTGTNYISQYNWPINIWNRWVIRAWKDYLTQKTFI